jgi:hypothetical protein
MKPADDMDDVKRAYRAAGGDAGPPPALDDAIRAAARRAVQARPRPVGQGWIGRWRTPLSAAAVMVLAVSVVFVAIEEQPEVAPPALRDAAVARPAQEVAVPPAGARAATKICRTASRAASYGTTGWRANRQLSCANRGARGNARARPVGGGGARRQAESKRGKSVAPAIATQRRAGFAGTGRTPPAPQHRPPQPRPRRCRWRSRACCRASAARRRRRYGSVRVNSSRRRRQGHGETGGKAEIAVRGAAASRARGCRGTGPAVGAAAPAPAAATTVAPSAAMQNRWRSRRKAPRPDQAHGTIQA